MCVYVHVCVLLEGVMLNFLVCTYLLQANLEQQKTICEVRTYVLSSHGDVKAYTTPFIKSSIILLVLAHVHCDMLLRLED